MSIKANMLAQSNPVAKVIIYKSAKVSGLDMRHINHINLFSCDTKHT